MATAESLILPLAVVTSATGTPNGELTVVGGSLKDYENSNKKLCSPTKKKHKNNS